MKKGNEFLDSSFEKFNGRFWESIFESFTEGQSSNRAKKISAFIFIALMTYAGVEFVKILFRKNFGKTGLRSSKLIFVCIALAILVVFAAIGYADYENVKNYWIYGSKNALLFTAIFYSFLILFVAIRGLIEKNRNNIHPISSYRGTSTVLSFLIEQGWKPSLVQNLAEPILLMAIGVFLIPTTSLLLGGPLVLFSISYWLHLLLETLMDFHNERNQMANTGHEVDQETTFVEVIN